MPGKSNVALGNEVLDTLFYISAVTFPTLAANASGTNTLSVPGTLVGDYLSWNMQNPPAHLVLDNAYVSANGTITLLWSSDSTGISTSTVAVLFELCRADTVSVNGLAGLPSSIT